MTNEECLKRLKEMRFKMQLYTYNNEALDYAIDRLSPCDDSKCEEIKTEMPPCTGSSVQKNVKHNIQPIEIKPKFEEKKCKVGYIRADEYPTTEVKFVEEIQKVLVGYEEVLNLDIVSKINEIIKVVNGGE